MRVYLRVCCGAPCNTRREAGECCLFPDTRDDCGAARAAVSYDRIECLGNNAQAERAAEVARDEHPRIFSQQLSLSTPGDAHLLLLAEGLLLHLKITPCS